MFSSMKPCDMKQCTLVGSTPLSVQAINVLRFKLGSYVDSHGQRLPLGMEVPNVHYVPQSNESIVNDPSQAV